MILLTGATGYVGGRLLPLLEKRGEAVRCLARRPEIIKPRVGPRTEVVAGDLLTPTSLEAALLGVETAYYLVHSMGSEQDFMEEDRAAARNFAAAARAAGVSRIIYLGGLGEGELSPHLESRQEVGRILAESGAAVIEFRASIVIGSGSISYEMVRALVERLPVMTTPSWVRVLAQPIAVEDLLAYLIAVLDKAPVVSAVYEIGGKDRVSYEQIMREYARQRGLSRMMIPVAVLTPWLSSLWLAVVTPIYARIGRRLFTSLRHETVVRDDKALRDFAVRPRGLAEAITRASTNEDREYAESRWFDALSSNGRAPKFPGASARRVDARSVDSSATPGRLFEEVAALGGAKGWPYHWLWVLRGILDQLAGGVGMRRGRPVGRSLRVGDALDFWRVEVLEPARRLRLRAEMRLPGRGWLEFEIVERGGGSRLTQTSVFEPHGLSGLLYWYALVPVHAVIFAGMARGLARRAER
ncbi:MAG: SDR family oxidoreductase [Elusimicrobiota bacterium]|nr:SDR family oxidoreductase [Elusimicrobiota bacterium]